MKSDGDFRPPQPSKAEIIFGFNEMEYVPARPVAIKDAAGYVAAEFIVPYPPGTPILVPGQRITKAHVEYLLKIIELGGDVVMLDSEKRRVYVIGDGYERV